ncbi:hypothetical protein [Rhizobium sp. CAU 1783]
MYIAIALVAMIAGGVAWVDGMEPLCLPGEACLREWISATSGWAAVIAAIPTILYLSKQVRDADRHQRTGFAIQLRRHRILAHRTAQIAHVSLMMIEGFDSTRTEGESPDVRKWDLETTSSMIGILRDTTIAAFEAEIAHPMSMSGAAIAMVIERGYEGQQPASSAAPELARSFFSNIARQAEDYLAETKSITE